MHMLCVLHCVKMSGFVSGTQKEKYAAPPINVPHHLRDCFTRCGSIPIESYFVDDSFGGQGSHYVFKRPQLDAMIAAAARTPVAARRDKLRWAVAAIMSLDLTGKRVIVFGSTAPRFEALCLARGAATVVTVEHNQLTYEHPQLQTMTVAQFELQQDSLAGTFDIALSVSRCAATAA